MKDLELLEELVLDWADLKGILVHGTKLKQGLKTLEEVNELLVAIADNNHDEIKDAIADCVITLMIQAKMNGLCLTECVQSGYDIISKRSGSMVAGQFVKDK